MGRPTEERRNWGKDRRYGPRKKKKRKPRNEHLPCVQCGHVPSGRPRGLCWACYKQGKDSATRTGQRGIVRPGRQHAPRPTDACPGSEEKIRELIARAEAGYYLFHPDDARDDSRREIPPQIDLFDAIEDDDEDIRLDD